MDDPTMPDLSHLSAEEREIIESVLRRQKEEEVKETQIAQKADEELDQIDKQINERKESARRLVGTQDDAICQICQKTKFADGIGHKCFYCQLRSCARCGGRAQSKNKAIWACSLCQKRQQILAKTGKWFQQEVPPKPSSPSMGQPGVSESSSPMGQTPLPPAHQQPQQQPQIICPPNNGPTPRQTNGPQAPMSSEQQFFEQQQQGRVGPTGPTMSNGPNGPNMRKQNTLTRQPTMEQDQRNQPQPMGNQMMGNGKLRNMEPNRTAEQQRQRMPEAVDRRDEQNRTRPRQDEQRPLFTIQGNDDTMYNQPQSSFNQMQPSGSFQQGYQQAVNFQQPQQPGYPQESTQFPQQNFQQQNFHDQNSFQQPQPNQRNQQGYTEPNQRASTSKAVPAVPAAVPPVTPVGSTSRTQPEFRRTRSIREEEGRRGSIGLRLDQQQPSTSTNSSQLAQQRPKKEKRLHRQLRSMSSSDEEVPLPSTSHEGAFQEEARQRLPNECNSERDLLRYIYSGEKIKNGRKSGQTRPLFGSVEPGGGRPTVPPAVIPGEQLAAKIRTYLSHPVTWQPSADQRTLIGHMVLSRVDGEKNGDLGLKVVGGRRTDTGRLGAFITRVKVGSVADTIGRLKAGDEVLEWNGTTLTNATYDQVYETISKSKNDSQIDLIVSRSAWRPGGDDFLQIHGSPYTSSQHHRYLPNPQFVQDYSEAELYGPASPIPPQMPHSQSAFLPSRVGMQAAYYQPELETYGKGTIFGKIEIACVYSHHDRQLTVLVERAFDLAPRPDGVPRNPYVKLFLLPDRSEYSRRQTAVIAESLCPIWGESFFYNQLSEPALFERALEVTVWDYDKLDSNAFLGEVLIDFSTVPLDGAPMLFTLTDMDEENPLRTRLRQRKMSQYAAVPQRMRDDPPRPHSEMTSYGYQRGRQQHRPEPASQYLDGYGAPMRRSRTYDRYGKGHVAHGERSPHHHYHGHSMTATPTMPEEDWTANQPSGYLSDHAHSHQPRFRHRRPRSATAMRHLTAAEMSASRMYPRAPIDDWDDVATPESIRGPALHHHRDPRSPNGRVLMETMAEQQGYGSDGSETLSIHSQHSNPVIHTINRRPRAGPSLMPDPHHDMDEYVEEDRPMRRRGDMMGQGSSKEDNAVAMKERKKSLMTRFIPGKSEAGVKRTGFARSEEVGIPENLSADRLPAMLKQASKESTDSGDNFLPVLPDGQLGPFVDNLGPGQVVGRQVLASSPAGELKIAIMGGRGGIEVEIIQAMNLVVKHGMKVLPGLYVKVYLMEGKTCLAKAKTQIVRSNSVSPMIRQRLHFHENPRKKMLQIMVLGDHGRMERKQFIGIAQIRLDDIELGAQPVTGTYKLYPSNSIAGMAPVRKDSENSLTGPQP